MIKVRLAYDGRGNFLVESRDQFREAVEALGGLERGLYAEKFAPFTKELSVMVVKAMDEQVVIIMHIIIL